MERERLVLKHKKSETVDRIFIFNELIDQATERLEKVFARFGASKWDDETVEPDYSVPFVDKLGAYTPDIHSTIKTMQAGKLTVNQARTWIGLPALKNGDRYLQQLDEECDTPHIVEGK